MKKTIKSIQYPNISVDGWSDATSRPFIDNPLEFWKNNRLKFPLLANQAKKYLGIPATSAAVERMFSICGHIFSLKRRRMGVKIIRELVFLKLNEKFV